MSFLSQVIAFTLLGLVGFWGAITVTVGPSLKPYGPGVRQSENANANLWLFVTGLRGSTCAVSSLLMYGWFRQLWPHVTNRGLHIWAYVTVLAVVLVVTLAVQKWPFEKVGPYSLKLQWLFNSVERCVAFAAVLGMWLVAVATLGASAEPRTLQSQLEFLLERRNDMNQFLMIAGIILGLGTVGIAALRKAVNTEGQPESFKSEYVILYGTLFSFLLALAYLPVHRVFVELGSALLYGLPPLEGAGGVDALSKWLSNRQAVEDALLLKSGVLAGIAGSLSIVTPFFSGVISELLGRVGKPNEPASG
jgi:hypothetical protein